MNCKQGDLAIIVSSRCEENIGKIVRCLKFIPKGTGLQTSKTACDSWEVDILVRRKYLNGPLEGQTFLIK